MDLGVMPGSAAFPWIVWVFPEPVWPYAKMQTLYPSMALWTSLLVSSKIYVCVESGPNTESNVYLCGYCFPCTVAVNSSSARTIICLDSSLSSSVLLRGLILQNNLIAPFISSSWLCRSFLFFCSSLNLFCSISLSPLTYWHSCFSKAASSLSLRVSPTAASNSLIFILN